MSLPNVIMVHPSANSDELMQKSSIVATISGTVGLECGFYNKHCITFTDTEFSHLSHVHRIKNMEELPNKIKDCIDKKVDINEIQSVYEKIFNNSFAIDETDVDNDINTTFRIALRESRLKIIGEKVLINLP